MSRSPGFERRGERAAERCDSTPNIRGSPVVRPTSDAPRSCTKMHDTSNDSLSPIRGEPAGVRFKKLGTFALSYNRGLIETGISSIKPRLPGSPPTCSDAGCRRPVLTESEPCPRLRETGPATSSRHRAGGRDRACCDNAPTARASNREGSHCRPVPDTSRPAGVRHKASSGNGPMGHATLPGRSLRQRPAPEPHSQDLRRWERPSQAPMPNCRWRPGRECMASS